MDHPTPDARSRALPPPVPTTPPAAAAGRRLALIVDDERSMGSLLSRALASRGWETVVATGPTAATALAQQRRPDLLVTDLHMPGMSGIDLARSLRTALADLPVVLVSGSPEAADLALPPPFAFVAKPFSLDALFSAVGDLVETGPGEA